MIAVVQIGGEQLRVEKGKILTVNRLNEKSGKKISFNDVLLIENNGSIQVGSPKIEKAIVSASILEHFKGEKVIVFKKKRRKGYKVKNGHRQYLTKIKIEDISLNEKKTPVKKEVSKTVKAKKSSVKKKKVSVEKTKKETKSKAK
jgi:large subunit ribosomal protein L21